MLLPAPCLQVWQYVAGDRPALSRQEFYTAMKLVSLAQVGAGGSQLSQQRHSTPVECRRGC